MKGIPYGKAISGWTQHPKVRILARLLKCSVVESRGYIAALRDFACTHAEDGILTGREMEVAVACDYPGEPALYMSALVEVRIVDLSADGALELHDHASTHDDFFRDRERKREERQRARELRTTSAKKLRRPRTGRGRGADGARTGGVKGREGKGDGDVDEKGRPAPAESSTSGETPPNHDTSTTDTAQDAPRAVDPALVEAVRVGVRLVCDPGVVVAEQDLIEFATALARTAVDPAGEIRKLEDRYSKRRIRRNPGPVLKAWIKNLDEGEKRRPGYPARSTQDRKREERERREVTEAAERVAAQVKADAEASRQRDEGVIAAASVGALQAAMRAAQKTPNRFELAQLRRPDWRETALGCQLVAAQLRLQPGAAS